MTKERVSGEPFIPSAEANYFFKIFDVFVCGIGIIFLNRMEIKVKAIDKLMVNTFHVKSFLLNELIRKK